MGRDMIRIQFSLCTVLIVMTWVAVVLGFRNWLGPHGLGLGLYLVVGSWYAISLTKTPAFRPLNNERLSVADVLTLLAICGVFHALALPAVTSPCHTRPAVAPPLPPNLAQPSTDPVQEPPQALGPNGTPCDSDGTTGSDVTTGSGVSSTARSAKERVGIGAQTVRAFKRLPIAFLRSYATRCNTDLGVEVT